MSLLAQLVQQPAEQMQQASLHVYAGLRASVLAVQIPTRACATPWSAAMPAKAAERGAHSHQQRLMCAKRGHLRGALGAPVQHEVDCPHRQAAAQPAEQRLLCQLASM